MDGALSLDSDGKVIGRRMVFMRKQRGLTLLECTLALVIIPMAVAAATMAIVAGQSQATEALRRSRAASLGDALMEQILANPYDQIESYCTSFSETPGNLRDGANQLYPAALQSYQRTVSCQTQTINMPAYSLSQNGLLVTVTVTLNGASMVQLKRFVPG